MEDEFGESFRTQIRLFKQGKRYRLDSEEALARKLEGNQPVSVRKAARLVATRPRPLNCEACGEEGKPYFDHCHARNIFRGWLCRECNFALGFCRDDPARLKKLADYQEKFLASCEDRVHMKSSAVPFQKRTSNPTRALPGNCESCGEKRNLYVDHDHKTKSFRGWICGECTGLLDVAGDSPLLLYSHYLSRSGTETEARSVKCDCCNRGSSGRKNSLVFDQDEKTKKYRGWLCRLCYQMIQKLPNQPDRMRHLFFYIRKFTEKQAELDHSLGMVRHK